MANIKVLDSSIFNRIAAGEVVESPYSVVKELVENSIDAKSTAITIGIESGGIDLIYVKDNGNGIDKKDVLTAFLPHATSKVTSLDCLNSIATLGFRGEALPSIASVAEVHLISKRKNDELGYSVKYEYGKLVDSGEVGARKGTDVYVKKLFDKIPARKKFLKKPASEAGRITDLVKKLILANPAIAFKYSVDGQTIYNTNGGGFESAVYSVYGSEIEKMAQINHSVSGITLKGYASLPELTRHNRNSQTIIVNNRVVENEDIGYSIYLAYKDFLMTRRFPVYVLYLEIPYDLVDVNVHPNKMQVKFVDSNGIKKMIYSAVKKVIAAHTNAANVMFGRGGATSGVTITATQADDIFGISEYGLFGSNSQTPNAPVNDGSQAQQVVLRHNVVPYTAKTASPFLSQNNNTSSVIACEPGVAHTPTRHSILNDFLSENSSIHANDGEITITKSSEWQNLSLQNGCHHNLQQNHQQPSDDFVLNSSLVVAGKLFSTYLLLQLKDDVFILDQHAAHEKLLYDKFIAQIDSGTVAVQPLLVPYSFNVSLDEFDTIEDKKQDLAKLGFELSAQNSSSFSLTQIPLVLSSINLSSFVLELVATTSEPLKKSDLLKEKLAQSACKAAVKAGDELSKNEIMLLVKQMLFANTMPLCPHGRPIIIKLTKNELELMFKRKV